MAVYEDKTEINIEIGNPPVAPSRRFALKNYTDESGEVASAVHGGKLRRRVAVSFSLLCILQAALNICLRLTLSPPLGVDVHGQNITETDNLRMIHSVSSEPGTAAIVKNLTDERDVLQWNLNNLALKLTSLTEERDELKSQLDIYDLYSQQGWLYFKSSFYYVSSVRNTWKSSREVCLQHEADLVVINTREEQEFIMQFKKIAWIGLTDMETEHEWKWVDGTPLTTSFWYAGEPNNYLNTNEDCVEARFLTRESWNDRKCESENFWICEKKMTP